MSVARLINVKCFVLFIFVLIPSTIQIWNTIFVTEMQANGVQIIIIIIITITTTNTIILISWITTLVWIRNIRSMVYRECVNDRHQLPIPYNELVSISHKTQNIAILLFNLSANWTAISTMPGGCIKIREWSQIITIYLIRPDRQ